MRFAPNQVRFGTINARMGCCKNGAITLTLRAHLRMHNPMGHANSNQINALLATVPELCPKIPRPWKGHNFWHHAPGKAQALSRKFARQARDCPETEIWQGKATCGAGSAFLGRFVFVHALLYGAVGSFILNAACGLRWNRVGVYDAEQIIGLSHVRRVQSFVDDSSSLIGQDFKEGAVWEG